MGLIQNYIKKCTNLFNKNDHVVNTNIASPYSKDDYSDNMNVRLTSIFPNRVAERNFYKRASDLVEVLPPNSSKLNI